MKIKITLDNGAGELDSAVRSVPGRDDDLVNRVVHSVIDKWTLREGDTITIVEVSE